MKDDKECIVSPSVPEKANGEPIKVDMIEVGDYRFSEKGIETIDEKVNVVKFPVKSDTLDFILADCLRIFDKAVTKIQEWYGGYNGNK